MAHLVTQKRAVRIGDLFQGIKQILSRIIVFELLWNEKPERKLILGHFAQPEMFLLKNTINASKFNY